MKLKLSSLILSMVLLPLTSAFAADELNAGDTAWVIVSTALVMMMTPAGLALFYGGMPRYKNLLTTYAMTFAAYCLASIVWVAWGYSLAFGRDIGGFVGGLEHFLSVSIVGTAVFSAAATLLVIAITRLLTGTIRIDKDSEIQGFDSAFHGERGFEIQT